MTEDGGRVKASELESPRRRSAWVYYVAAGIGATWFVGAVGYMFYTRVLTPGLTWLGRVCWASICFMGLVWVVAVLWPVGMSREVHPDEIGNMWVFVRRSAPQNKNQRALWRKFRTCIAILIVMMLLMLTWGIILSFGLANA